MNNNQPVSFRTNLLVSAAVVLVMLAISGYMWFQIPAGVEVCTHWNAAGNCDGWGSKAEGLFAMPIVVVIVAALFVVMPRIDPRKAHIAQSGKAYTAMWMAMLLFFLVFHIVLMLDLLGYKVNIGSLVSALVGLLFVAIGTFIGRVRSNYFFGIRTAWTLSSELSWQKTHRLGGRLFIVEGLLVVVGAIAFPGELWVYLLLGSLFVMVAVLALYSYFIWKGDPDRTHQEL